MKRMMVWLVLLGLCAAVGSVRAHEDRMARELLDRRIDLLAGQIHRVQNQALFLRAEMDRLREGEDEGADEVSVLPRYSLAALAEDIGKIYASLRLDNTVSNSFRRHQMDLERRFETSAAARRMADVTANRRLVALEAAQPVIDEENMLKLIVDLSVQIDLLDEAIRAAGIHVPEPEDAQ